jgi:hypothetical protein
MYMPSLTRNFLAGVHKLLFCSSGKMERPHSIVPHHVQQIMTRGKKEEPVIHVGNRKLLGSGIEHTNQD